MQLLTRQRLVFIFSFWRLKWHTCLSRHFVACFTNLTPFHTSQFSTIAAYNLLLILCIWVFLIIALPTMCPGRSLIGDSNHLLSFFSKVSHPLWSKAAKSLQTLGLPRFVVSYTCFGGLGQGFGRCFVGGWLNMVMGHKRKLDSCQLVSQWNARGV